MIVLGLNDTESAARAPGTALATGIATGLARGVGLIATVAVVVGIGAAAYFGYRYFKRRGRRRR